MLLNYNILTNCLYYIKRHVYNVGGHLNGHIDGQFVGLPVQVYVQVSDGQCDGQFDRHDDGHNGGHLKSRTISDNGNTCRHSDARSLC